LAGLQKNIKRKCLTRGEILSASITCQV